MKEMQKILAVFLPKESKNIFWILFMCEDYSNAGKTQPLLKISIVITIEVLHVITS